MGHSAIAKTHVDVVDDFIFLQNYTVKWIINEDSDSQCHSEYISIERKS